VDDEPEFGSDTGPFILAGLPGIFLSQDSPNYKYTHHSPVDTLDKVDPAVLDRNAAVISFTAFWVADRPERLATRLAGNENRADAGRQASGQLSASLRNVGLRRSRVGTTAELEILS